MTYAHWKPIQDFLKIDKGSPYRANYERSASIINRFTNPGFLAYLSHSSFQIEPGMRDSVIRGMEYFNKFIINGGPPDESVYGSSKIKIDDKIINYFDNYITQSLRPYMPEITNAFQWDRSGRYLSSSIKEEWTRTAYDVWSHSNRNVFYSAEGGNEAYRSIDFGGQYASPAFLDARTMQAGSTEGQVGAAATSDLAARTMSDTEGDDHLLASADETWESGGHGADVIDGTADSDWDYGGNGNDTLFGGAGDDVVDGEGDDDFVGAGAGNDTAWGSFGNDEIHGEGGDDLLFGEDGGDGVYGEDGHDEIFGGSGDDVLTGDRGSDFVRGETDDDRLFGGEDGDDLSGGAGNDTLEGGAGPDLLFGNAGDDVLAGGAGTDIFGFGAGDGLDEITDFVTGGSEADVIAFNGGAFTSFEAVQAASRQEGADIVISYGTGDALTLRDTQLAALSAASFTFA
ncbi:calcium-binding protein [Methylobacterium tarhaniae]|uniref:calcium-binding protein n=1 Tax=Methylobacterium tarhaniae TaxID=1187852 RepID=UPI000B2F458D|nr:calcium-binding protein [Methylobacterium tarhaniae]